MKYFLKQFCSTKLLLLLVFIGAFSFESYGQCDTCTTTISSNSQSSYTASAGTTICVANGFDYTGTIVLSGGTLCNQGTVHNITFNSGTFENYGIYSKTSGTVSISNTGDVIINCYNNASVSLNKLTITNVGLLNINILTGSEFNVNSTLTINSVAYNNNNGWQIRIYDVNIAIASMATLNVIGDVNVISGKLQLDNGSNAISRVIGIVSFVNFSRQFNVSNSSGLILNNYRNAILNVRKSISLSNSGLVRLTNTGIINTSLDFNITGNAQLIGSASINNSGTISITRNLNAAYTNGLLHIINSSFITKGGSGGLFIGGSYSQTQANIIFDNNGIVIATNDVNISKGSFNNNHTLQARTLFVKEGTLNNSQDASIFLSRNLSIGNQANNSLQSALVNNAGTIDVANVLNNKSTLNLFPSSIINTTHLTNQTQGIIDRNFGNGNFDNFDGGGNLDKIYLKGNWVNNGTINTGGGEVIFTGGTPLQTISGSIANQGFYFLTMDKPSGIVQLNSPVAILSTLTLTKGIITSSATNIIELGDDAVSSRGSDDAYVHGPMKKTGNDAFTFPLGDISLTDGAFHPISISATENPTDSYIASYTIGSLANYDSIQEDSLSSVSMCEHFTLTRSSGSSIVIPSIGWNSNSCIPDILEDIVVAGWDGSQWKSLGSAGIIRDERSSSPISGIEKSGSVSATSGISIGTLTLTFGTAIVRPAPVLPCANDVNRNWISSRTFDGSSNVISESRAYSDYLGRATQNQVRNITENNILATQTIYDAFGRAVIQTLPAPINQSSFCYKEGFITNATETDYNYSDFDVPNYTTHPTTIFSGEVDKPKNVSNSTIGTLGWYYSNNNTMEPYVATSGIPYTRVEQDDNNGGVVIKSASAGSFLSMGAGHEMNTFTMPVAGELKYVYGFANGWEIESVFETNDYPEFAEGHVISNFQPEIKAVKTINLDQNGVETISISDHEGKLLATCLSGSVNGANVQTQHVTSVIKPGVPGQDYVDIHLPAGCETTLTLTNSTTAGSIETYNIYNFKTGQYVKFSGIIDFTATIPNLEPGYYRIIFKSGAMVSELYAKYDLNYYNFSINYYDKAGRLKMTIPPAGIDLAYNPSITTASNSANKLLKYVSSPSGTDPNWSLNTTSSFDDEVSANITLPVTPEVQITNVLAVLSRNPVLIHVGTAGGSRSMSVDYLSSTPTPQSFEIGDDFDITDPDEPIDGSSIRVYNYEVTFDIKNQSGYVVATGLKLNAKHSYIYGFTGAGPIDNGWTFDSPESAIVYPIPSNTTSQVIAVVTNIQKTAYIIGGVSLGIQPLDADLDNLRFSIFTQTEKLPGIPIHTMPVAYDYNSNNWLLSDQTTDEGKTEYVYERDGRIRFSQNAKQKASSALSFAQRFSYTNYDVSKRVVEAGEFTPILAGDPGNMFFENYYDFNPSTSYSGTQSVHTGIENAVILATAGCTDQNFISYDFPDADFYTLTGLSSLSYQQEFTLYKVSKTWNSNKTTWYSYDELGKVKWMVQRIENMPIIGSYKIATVNYVYDIVGNVTKVEYNKEVSAESFYHFYTYDADNRLSKVYTNTDDSNIKEEQATYYYYKHGPLKRVEIANKTQGLDYVYTINGWLKSMNAPELNERDPGKDGTTSSPNNVPKDLFAFTLDYFGGDYIRASTSIQTFDDPTKPNLTTNLYNGLVKDFRWQTQTPLIASGLSYTNSQLMYAYKYDKKYQITDATFGAITDNGTLNPIPPGPSVHDYYGPKVSDGTDYLVSGITYDLQGNIQTLNRNAYAAGGALSMDQMTYNYQANTNKLSSVADAIVPNNYSNLNFKSGQSTSNYAYDDIGQLLDDNSENNFYSYDVYGKVTEVYSNSSRTILRAKFVYDENGKRLKKISYDGSGVVSNETWYVRDASGNELSIYEKPAGLSLQQSETGIFAANRIGIRNSQTGKSTYELTDHLGNVRTTFALQADYLLASDFNGAGGEDDYLFNFNITTDNTFYRGSSGSSIKVDGGNPIGASISIPVTTGQVISVNVYSYFDLTGIPANAQLVFELKDNAGTVISTQDNPIVLTPNSWQLLAANYTVPIVTAGTKITIYPRWQGANPQPVWFDDIVISLTPNAENIGVVKLEQNGLTDYYPHGGIIPGRNYVGVTYRFGYQGQFAEKDSETGFNNFELRMWDGRLGRWMNPDPYRQYHSPYIGMGNNPINIFDPNGGYDNSPCPYCGNADLYRQNQWVSFTWYDANGNYQVAQWKAVGEFGRRDWVAGPRYTFLSTVEVSTTSVETDAKVKQDIYDRQMAERISMSSKFAFWYNQKAMDYKHTPPAAVTFIADVIKAPLMAPANIIKGGFTGSDMYNKEMGWKDYAGNVVEGALSWAGAGAIGGGGGAAESVVFKEGQTIVGEGMKRVSVEAAKRPGSVILTNMPKFSGTADQITSQMMAYNRQWILQQMRSGRPIVNIGLDLYRANPSIFYQMELNMMKNYLKLHPNAFQFIK